MKLQSEDDGQGGRRKKQGLKHKIKEILPGGGEGNNNHQEYDSTTTPGNDAHGRHQGYYEHQEKKGIMDKIKDKLPGTHRS